MKILVFIKNKKFEMRPRRETAVTLYGCFCNTLTLTNKLLEHYRNPGGGPP